MKIFGWMQSKLNGKQKTNKTVSQPTTHHLKHESCKEEFSDWPSGLLTIGTFGNDNIKNPEKTNVQENVSPCQDHLEEITPEEVKELHKELKLLLHKQSSLNCNLTDESEKGIYPPEKFFDCLQTLEDDRNASELVSDNSSSKDAHLQGNTNAIYSRGNSISKRSLSFLLRKTFLGAGRPKLTPMLRDPVPEIKLEKSRMEKILRAILHKKIYPQSPTPKVSTKKFLDKICPQSSNPNAPARKCLDNKYESETDSDDEKLDKSSEGSKWVKTDSEFIVLEI